MEWLKNLFFPPKCAACSALLDFTHIEAHHALCKDCWSLFWDEQKEICLFCRCEVNACTCAPELLKKAGSTQFYKTVYYRHGKGAAVQNRMIFRIKNNRDSRTSRFFANALARELKKREQKGEICLQGAIITYVPRRRRAVLEKGTDQARMLANMLSKELGIPSITCLVRRRFAQKEQKTLPPAERMRNARASFSLKDGAPIVGKTVLLVDDIVTTGASMAACVQKLLADGAGEVICIAAASDDTNQAPISPQPTRKK